MTGGEGGGGNNRLLQQETVGRSTFFIASKVFLIVTLATGCLYEALNLASAAQHTHTHSYSLFSLSQSRLCPLMSLSFFTLKYTLYTN